MWGIAPSLHWAGTVTEGPGNQKARPTMRLWSCPGIQLANVMDTSLSLNTVIPVHTYKKSKAIFLQVYPR